MRATLAYLAAAALGLLAGAMLLIALAIVPFWTSLEPVEFVAWFQKYSPLLGGVMLPLGASATVLAVLAALAAAVQRSDSSQGFPYLALAAALSVVVAGVYPLHFTSANAALASGRLTADQVVTELQSWRIWHWIRTGAGIVAFLSILRGAVLQGR